VLRRLATIVLPLLLVGAPPAPTLAGAPAPTLVQHAGNVLGSMQAASDDLATLLTSLEMTSARLQAVAGQAGILALSSDAERIDRSCEALARKAGRLEEIAAELESALTAPE